MANLNEILSNEHTFKVQPIGGWSPNLLNYRFDFPSMSNHHNTMELINEYYNVINEMIRFHFKVDFYSAKERNNFKELFDNLINFSILTGGKNYYGVIKEDTTNDEIEYILKINFRNIKK